MIVFFCWVAAAMLLAAAILHASDEHVYANIVLGFAAFFAFFAGIVGVVALLNYWQGV